MADGRGRMSRFGVIQQDLNLGAIDEMGIALAPVLFGGGRRPFENLREPMPRFRIDTVLAGPAATHLRYVREGAAVATEQVRVADGPTAHVPPASGGVALVGAVHALRFERHVRSEERPVP